MAFTKPTNTAPLNTVFSGTNTVEPDVTRQASGWAPGDKPPAQYLNHLQGTYHRWLRYIDERISDLVSDGLQINTPVGSAGALDILTFDDGVNSGNVRLKSGDVAGTASGSASLLSGDNATAASGQINVKSGTGGTVSGDVVVGSGNAPSSGEVTLTSGEGSVGASGRVLVFSGVSLTDSSGNLEMGTQLSDLSSGSVLLSSGPSTSGTSGALSFSTGAGLVGSGSISISTGTSTGAGDAGDITIQAGDHATLDQAGNVDIRSGKNAASSEAFGFIRIHTGPDDPTPIVPLDPGEILIQPGDVTTVAGHDLWLVAGESLGATVGGDIYLWGGRSATGDGGTIQLVGGISSATGTGGQVTIEGGAANAGNTGGALLLRGGASASGATGAVTVETQSGALGGADLVLRTGKDLSNDNAGRISINTGTGSFPGSPGDISIVGNSPTNDDGANIFIQAGSGPTGGAGNVGQVTINAGDVLDSLNVAQGVKISGGTILSGAPNHAGGAVTISGGESAGDQGSVLRLQASTAGAPASGKHLREEYLTCDGNLGFIRPYKPLQASAGATGEIQVKSDFAVHLDGGTGFKVQNSTGVFNYLKVDDNEVLSSQGYRARTGTSKLLFQNIFRGHADSGVLFQFLTGDQAGIFLPTNERYFLPLSLPEGEFYDIRVKWREAGGTGSPGDITLTAFKVTRVITDTALNTLAEDEVVIPLTGTLNQINEDAVTLGNVSTLGPEDFMVLKVVHDNPAAVSILGVYVRTAATAGFFDHDVTYFR